MLQKADKDRLDKVLEVINSKLIRRPNATITKDLNEDSGNVSNYLNGKKPIPTKFYTDFMNKYAGSSESGQSTEKISGKLYMETIIELSQSCTRLTRTNEKLTDNNSELISMVKSVAPSVNLADLKESQLSVSAISLRTLEQMAENGIVDGLWKTKDEGLAKLGRLIVVSERVDLK